MLSFMAGHYKPKSEKEKCHIHSDAPLGEKIMFVGLVAPEGGGIYPLQLSLGKCFVRTTY